jgi:proline iminopeptidase
MKFVHVLAAVVPIAFACRTSSPGVPVVGPVVTRSSGLITVRGTPHPYLIEGMGPPCIVVGPAPGYARQFSDRLKQHVRLVYVDFKQSWNADTGAGPDPTLDALVEEVDEVRRALGLARACVIGHSAPGLVALEYAARHADVTSQVILIAVPPFLGPALTRTRAEFWAADATAERRATLERNVQRIPDDLLRRLPPRDGFAMRYVRNGPKYFYDASYDFSWAWLGQRVSTELIVHFLGFDIDPRLRLTSNTVPILVVLGRYDYAVPYPLWDGIEGRIPHVTRARLERSGHFPMLDEPAAFDDAVIHWLETARGQREIPPG